MDNRTVIIVENLVHKFIYGKKSFTILDVTNEANKILMIYHHDCKKIVHTFMKGYLANNQDYTSTTIEVNTSLGVITDAILYHHKDSNPNDYLDRTQSIEYFDLKQTNFPQ